MFSKLGRCAPRSTHGFIQDVSRRDCRIVKRGAPTKTEGMTDRETAIEIARLTAAVASGEMAEEAAQQAINVIRRATGTDDSLALDGVQEVGSHVLGVGSVASDVAGAVTGGLFDLLED